MRFAILLVLCPVAVAGPLRTVLPADVSDVYVDVTGRAIQQTHAGDWRATAQAVFAGQGSRIDGARVLLIDHLHRIWLMPEEEAERATVQVFDGKSWIVRHCGDLPADSTRRLEAVHFLSTAVEDAVGNVWLIDGDAAQGWWLHQFTPAGAWVTKAVHERALAAAQRPAQSAKPPLKFAEPVMQIGPDGLFYVSWSSTRTDHGSGMGASGFGQFDGNHWSEYFYPAGSTPADNVQSIIPLPDGSVGFIRTIDEPRVVWMTSALSRPAPDLTSYLNRLTSLSPRERETAQAELVAMGPRLRKALETLVDQTDEPEIKARLPIILQDISKPPVKGLYGGKLTFSAWRLLHIARSGRVYLAVRQAVDKSTGKNWDEALVTVSPDGVWSAAESPTSKFGQPSASLKLFEDAVGRRWLTIANVGVFISDSETPLRKISDAADAAATICGVDSNDRLYLRNATNVVMLDPLH